ncbi:MAG: HepT-like ribonuclease domain-containing protein [Sulfuricurvum sp.]
MVRIKFKVICFHIKFIPRLSRKNYLLRKVSQENQIVVDFRNILIHHYFGIDAEEVWDVIHNDLKSFKFVILDAIKKIEATLKEELLGDIIDENNHLNFIVQVLNQLKEEC